MSTRASAVLTFTFFSDARLAQQTLSGEGITSMASDCGHTLLVSDASLWTLRTCVEFLRGMCGYFTMVVCPDGDITDATVSVHTGTTPTPSRSLVPALVELLQLKATAYVL